MFLPLLLTQQDTKTNGLQVKWTALVDFSWSYPMEHFYSIENFPMRDFKKSLSWGFTLLILLSVFTVAFFSVTPLHSEWLSHFALRLKWFSQSPVLQDGGRWGLGSGQARGSRLWRFPGARLQARCQGALWRRRPRNHVQKPQVGNPATLVGHGFTIQLWKHTHNSLIVGISIEPFIPIDSTTNQLPNKTERGYFLSFSI